MPRPMKCRKIGCDPEYLAFKPAGIPPGELEAVEMSFDELEAIRLADYLGLYQEEAAGRMHVSRQTFGNILSSARKKVGEMLVSGKQLTITGGSIMMTEKRTFRCASCSHEWSLEHGVQRPLSCPSCGSDNIHRSSPGGGFGGGRGGGGRCRGLRTGLNRSGQGEGLGQGLGQGIGRGAGTVHDHDHSHDHSHDHANGGRQETEGGAA
ncbi:MAG: hypothetical protein A3K90_04335 [Pelodictyon luteolum]|uniref:UPF0251 protein A3K90_04335 n=1 Tax=Pelodictyon luteolum TaxID=1100 RepID=A0A165MBN4_PELLU|nr:DUF134 domain-containing protein [Pelodictyon luteolum]KZK75049.1 MAG: hypothetical protein A3K90_04335 [Pelodictyon luteolum]